ncbi:CbtA family protein, partial [Methylobacterium sp.]|uniref:CbtA family protein n=1 Tax=Methylobacterium sp. TaxID=409 RepID=UPI002629D50B
AERQFWWVMTAAATGMGLYLIAIRRAPIAIAGGIVLLVAPHLAGAPVTSHAASNLPAAYAAQFAARSLGIAFVFWAVIGLAYGWAWNLFGKNGVDATGTAHA